MSQQATSARPLDYAPPDSARSRRRRRITIWAIVHLCFIVFLFFGTEHVYKAYRHLSRLSSQRQCMTFSLPPDFVVHEENGERAAQLLASGNNSYSRLSDGIACHVPPPWRIYHPIFIHQGVLFLHKLQSPGGNVRLVAIEIASMPHLVTDPASDTEIDNVTLYAEIYAPASLTGGGQYLSQPMHSHHIWLAASDQLRFYAGQIDPADPSHFTIEYETNGVADIIDGQLGDDDIVTLTSRRGTHGSSGWYPTGSKHR